MRKSYNITMKVNLYYQDYQGYMSKTSVAYKQNMGLVDCNNRPDINLLQLISCT